MKKKLKELFSDEINIDFVDNIHIEEKKILNYIHKWPEKFYSAFIKIQKKNLKTHEIVLPSGEGTIVVQQNCKTKKIDVFLKKQTEKVDNKRFNQLLTEMFNELKKEKKINKKMKVYFEKKDINNNLEEIDNLMK